MTTKEDLIRAAVIIGLLVFVVALVYFMESKFRDRTKSNTLYDRLGGIYSIAAVVDHFSDRLIDNPTVGKDSSNPQLRQWHREQLDRLPGLKFMRTLWLADKAGGPYRYEPTRMGQSRLGLSNAHCPLKINSDEFDAVAQELSTTLDYFKVPYKEKQEVLAAFAAHKDEVTACSQ